MIKIQKETFSIDKNIKDVTNHLYSIGAATSFIGYVRDFHQIGNDKYLYIEHYEGMTNKCLLKIEYDAKKKWDLIDVRIIHRVGKLNVGEPIVFVLVVSPHRDDSFEACRFIIDNLKVNAPFWKKEVSTNTISWVDQKKKDFDRVNYSD